MSNRIRVAETFQSVQGEGYQFGKPMLFVRLAGCSLGCAFCDTKQYQDPESGKEMAVTELIEYIYSSYRNINNICITGGEPLEQNEALELFIGNIHFKKPPTFIQLETNGRHFPEWLPKYNSRNRIWVTVSPKGFYVKKEWYKHADEFKYVIRMGADLACIPDRKVLGSKMIITLQAVDNNKDIAQEIVGFMNGERPDCRLSYQVHKEISVR